MGLDSYEDRMPRTVIRFKLVYEAKNYRDRPLHASQSM